MRITSINKRFKEWMQERGFEISEYLDWINEEKQTVFSKSLDSGRTILFDIEPTKPHGDKPYFGASINGWLQFEEINDFLIRHVGKGVCPVVYQFCCTTPNDPVLAKDICKNEDLEQILAHLDEHLEYVYNEFKNFKTLEHLYTYIETTFANYTQLSLLGYRGPVGLPVRLYLKAKLKMPDFETHAEGIHEWINYQKTSDSLPNWANKLDVGMPGMMEELRLLYNDERIVGPVEYIKAPIYFTDEYATYRMRNPKEYMTEQEIQEERIKADDWSTYWIKTRNQKNSNVPEHKENQTSESVFLRVRKKLSKAFRSNKKS